MKLTTTLVAGALVLAGCTTKNYYGEELKPLPTTGPTSTVKRTTTTTFPKFGQTSEAEFLTQVRIESSGARIMFDQDLLDAGWATCEAFDNGLTALEVVTVMSENMGSNSEFDELMIATASLATVWLCPEHMTVWSES